MRKLIPLFLIIALFYGLVLVGTIAKWSCNILSVLLVVAWFLSWIAVARLARDEKLHLTDSQSQEKHTNC